MKINEVNNVVKACDTFLIKGSTSNKIWECIWNKDINNNILTKKMGICYYIVVNGQIYKIGYTDGNGGIKGAITSYCSSGNGGRPSDRTHGIFTLISEELVKGNKVEFWFNMTPDITIDINLMDGTSETINTYVSGKELEKRNIDIYFKKYGNYPKWNLQESNKPWPKYIQDSRNRLLTEKKSLKVNDIIIRLRHDKLQKIKERLNN